MFRRITSLVLWSMLIWRWRDEWLDVDKVQVQWRWLRTVVFAHLSNSLGLNVTLEYHLGLAGHPEGRLDLLVILAHPPEFDVLVAVLRLQEGLEDLHAVWKHTGSCKTRGRWPLGAQGWHHLHLEANSLSRESDHWDVSSTRSLQETVATFKWEKSGHRVDAKTSDTFTYASVIGSSHDISRDLRLHLLEGQKISFNDFIRDIISSQRTKKMWILPFFFHLLVERSHVNRLQLPQWRCDKFKHCDSEQCERRSEVWLWPIYIYMCVLEEEEAQHRSGFTAGKRKFEGNDASRPCRYQPNMHRCAVSGLSFEFDDANVNNCDCGKFCSRQNVSGQVCTDSYWRNMISAKRENYLRSRISPKKLIEKNMELER